MRVAFAGSHEISWHCLRVIAQLCRAHGDTLAAAFNLPTASGARHSAFVEFNQLAAEFGFPQHRTANLGAPETLALMRELALDVLFVIGWHRIVPKEVLRSARYCVGMHSSLLPRNRGSAPVNWAIIRGEREGGMTFFHLTSGVDSGDIIGQKRFPIGARDTCNVVYDRATVAAVELLREHWSAMREGHLPRTPQRDEDATYNERRRPEDGRIDWRKPASQIDALVRALTRPYPGAFTTVRGRKLAIWSAEPVSLSGAEPGIVMSVGETIQIATGEGSLEARSLQFEGDPECSAAVFTATYQPVAGQRWGC